jgi:hypothetical protein
MRSLASLRPRGDLDVLGILGLEATEQEAEESSRDEVEEGQGHRRIMS